MKAGDQVVLHRSDGRREIKTVREVYGDLVDIGTSNSRYHFRTGTGAGVRHGKPTDERIEPATAELLADVAAELGREARERDEDRQRQEADPRTPYIRQLRNGDFLPWDTLTLQQLQQIAEWLGVAPTPTQRKEG